MSVKTSQYARKPFYVDAVRVTAENMEELTSWCLGTPKVNASDGRAYIHVDVHQPVNERQSQAFVGDWLLHSKNGFKVYTNQAFNRSFDGPNESGVKTHRTANDLATQHAKPGDRRKRSRQPENVVQETPLSGANPGAFVESVMKEDEAPVEVVDIGPSAAEVDTHVSERLRYLEENEEKLNTTAQQELFALRQANNTKEN